MSPETIQDGGEFRRERETGPIQAQATIFFVVSIAALGAIMMALTSSPTAKGASFLWLPAALQLVAGVWLGPWRGAIAGGVGAYLAGIIAYGGWGPVDILMNLVAGGIANSMIPAILFRVLRIDPSLRVPESTGLSDLLGGAIQVLSLTSICILIAFVAQRLHFGMWGYAPSILVVLATTPLLLRKHKVANRHLWLAVLICVLISALSALIGSFAQTTAGQTWPAALLGTGVGWFLGDTVSAILGLYVLASFTARARDAGILG